MDENEKPAQNTGAWTPEQLQDMVTVVTPGTEEETAYLHNVLAEAGVPVLAQSDEMHGVPGLPGPLRIRVPRAALDKALAVLKQTPGFQKHPKSTVIRSAETLALGIEWIFYPWFFVARERLAFSLFEFWITMLGCGMSTGLLVSRLSANNASVWIDILVSYAVLHTFLVALLGGVYEARRRRLKNPDRPASQILLVILFEIPAIIAWICVGLAINVPFRR